MTAAALVLAAAAPPAVDPVGAYRLRDGPDVASELRIRRDGRFDYALAAGALDEHSSGRWRRSGRQILLTTVPKPVPPVFSEGRKAKTATASLVLHVTWPDGREINGVELKVDFDAGPPLTDYIASDEGWSLPAAESRTPVAVTFSVPMHRLDSPRFPIDTARANELTFILAPNDLGRVDFRDLPVDVERGRLVMHRDGARLTYVRVKR